MRQRLTPEESASLFETLANAEPVHDSLESKMRDDAIRAAGVRVILDTHLKEMGWKYFKNCGSAPVVSWPEDSHNDPIEELVAMEHGDPDTNWLAVDDLDIGEYDNCEDTD